MKSIHVKFGKQLSSMIDGTAEWNFNDWFPNIRNEILNETQIEIPKFQLSVDEILYEFEYVIFFDNQQIASFDRLDPSKNYFIIPPTESVPENIVLFNEPAFNLPAVEESSLVAEKNNFNLVSSWQILSTHLTNLIRSHLRL